MAPIGRGGAGSRPAGRDPAGRTPAIPADRRRVPDQRATRRCPEPAGRVRRDRDRHPRLDRRAPGQFAARCLPDAGIPGRPDQHADRQRAGAQSAGGRQSRVPRHRVRGAPVHDRGDLRHVGGDRRRRREDQPGDGADDQRSLAAADAHREGGRDRRGRPDPVRRDRRAGPAGPRASRIGSRPPRSVRRGHLVPRSWA